jgi:DNA-binding transcriptional LysR family regulator
LPSEHPKLELDLNFTDRRVDIVEDGFDLAIRNGPLGEWPGLMARRLAHQRMTVCASPDYLRSAWHPDDHRRVCWTITAILYARSGRVRSWLFPVEGASGRWKFAAFAHAFRRSGDDRRRRDRGAWACLAALLAGPVIALRDGLWSGCFDQ